MTESAAIEQARQRIGARNLQHMFMMCELLDGDAHLIGDIAEQKFHSARTGRDGFQNRHRLRCTHLAVTRQQMKARRFAGRHCTGFGFGRAEDVAILSAQPLGQRLSSNTEHGLGINFVTEGAHNARQHALSVPDARQRRFAVAGFCDVAANAARAQPCAVLRDQRHGRNHHASRTAVAAAQPRFFVFDSPARQKRNLTGAGTVDHEGGRLQHHQGIGRIAQRSARRHEAEPLVGADLPSEVGGDIDEIFIAAAAVDQRYAQAVVERQIAQEQQCAATVIERHERYLKVLLLVALADINHVDQRPIGAGGFSGGGR